ncbi:hypothetical protein CYMTET_36896 [Cymbomonas tetramitiformis]|uniref:Uncharacterized protein n=1 Tax=Cymbomonas tetramitiformis TaxID=36881 RepID=A0AAE0CF11_9CHLO|nr:hypothetical protein CYMTET_36896 [Cymbomonas tetramitiformis]
MKYLGVEDSAAEEKVGVKDSAAEEKVVEEMRVEKPGTPTWRLDGGWTAASEVKARGEGPEAAVTALTSQARGRTIFFQLKAQLPPRGHRPQLPVRCCERSFRCGPRPIGRNVSRILAKAVKVDRLHSPEARSKHCTAQEDPVLAAGFQPRGPLASVRRGGVSVEQLRLSRSQANRQWKRVPGFEVAPKLRSAQPSAAAVVTWRISRWLHDGFTRVNYARRSLRREARRRGATDGTGMGQRKGMAVAAGKASLEPLDDLQIWMEVPGPTAKLIADSGNPCAGLRR